MKSLRIKRYLEEGSTEEEKESMVESAIEERMGGANMFKNKRDEKFFNKMLIPCSQSSVQAKR